MSYVDGFVIPMPRKNIAAYKRIAAKAGRIWREHGAIDYKECVGDDMKVMCGFPFPRLARLKRGEVVVFSYILYKSRAHRDKVNAKVMKDPRIHSMGGLKEMPFDVKRMSYGGFKTMVGD